MEIKQVVEYYTQEVDTNKIVPVSNTFIEGSVIVTKQLTMAGVAFKEMGTNLVRLTETVGVGEVLKIVYDMTVSTVNTDVDILKEIRALRQKCEDLERQQEYLLEALQERVPQATFKQWILLMEKSFGKPILENKYLMGVQGESLPHPWNKTN